MSVPNSPLDAMVAKAVSLYSLPAVAMEVIRLTDAPQVDTRALKECIERDPALAAKVLRVVNSSLFGLSGKVDNLTQAIALLGIKPLKLLVLGFSLPSALLDDLNAEQLKLYWRGALTRAVAARQLAEMQWQTHGDEAFLVALLEDLGILVLLQQLGATYARFLRQVRAEGQNLVELERESLAFDHRTLTIALLESWRLPDFYATAIKQSPLKRDTRGSQQAREVIPQVIALANLLAELVDEHRLSVLPELMERGEIYCGLDKEALNTLVADLEPQVKQLAGVLHLELDDAESYIEVLVRAHDRLVIVAEDAAGLLIGTEETLCHDILEESQALSRAVESLVAAPNDNHMPHDRTGQRDDAAQSSAPAPRGRLAVAAPAAARERCLHKVTAAAARCRTHRVSLSVIEIESTFDATFGEALTIDAAAPLRRALGRICDANQIPRERITTTAPNACCLILPNYGRRQAVEFAKQLARELAFSESAEMGGPRLAPDLKVGVAQIACIPKAFAAERLLDAAARCLAAARSCGATAIKSIEVY